MTSFLLVRDSDVLDRACCEVAELLAYRRRRTPHEPPAPLVGAWVERPLAVNPPVALRVQGRGGDAETVHVEGAVGVTGLWTLCWFDVDVSRVALLDALLAEGGAVSPGAPPGRFVPIYQGDEDPAQDERLDVRCPGHVAEPLRYDLATGQLAPLLSDNQ